VLFVTAENVLNQKSGFLFWGHSQTAVPFYGGVMCVALPRFRTPVQTSGGSATGSDCSGFYSFAFDSAYMASQGLVAGDVVNAQYWSRDPGFLPPDNVGLTDALNFTICF